MQSWSEKSHPQPFRKVIAIYLLYVNAIAVTTLGTCEAMRIKNGETQGNLPLDFA
jgi:hypothetical protein